MARRDELRSLECRSDRNPGRARRAFPSYGGNRCQNFYDLLCCTRMHSTHVLDLELIIVCQDRYACDVKDVKADFLTIMAALVKSGICSKAR